MFITHGVSKHGRMLSLQCSSTHTSKHRSAVKCLRMTASGVCVPEVENIGATGWERLETLAVIVVVGIEDNLTLAFPRATY